MSFRIGREDFERLAEKSLETLPGEYRKYFTNITITVEDYPSREDAGGVNVRRENLLGLFSGVPHPRKGGFFEIPYPLPDRIILFQKNIESICSSEKELIEQIQQTLIHEIGHYFGLSERELRKHGV